MWRDLLSSFDVIGEWLVWKVGSGSKLRIGHDPWIGSSRVDRIPHHMTDYLRDMGLMHLSQIGDIVLLLGSKLEFQLKT